MGEKILGIEEFAKVIVGLLPRKDLKKYEIRVFDKKLSLKNQFIVWCNNNWRVPKYSEEKTKEIFLEIMGKENTEKWREFDFSVLKKLTENWFDLVYGKESKKPKYW